MVYCNVCNIYLTLHVILPIFRVLLQRVGGELQALQAHHALVLGRLLHPVTGAALCRSRRRRDAGRWLQRFNNLFVQILYAGEPAALGDLIDDLHAPQTSLEGIAT